MKRFLFFFFLLHACISLAQIDSSLEFYHKPGFQVGYAYPGISKFEAGFNYYWVIDQVVRVKPFKEVFHTIGPSAGADFLYLPDRTIAGLQVGLNYHLYYVVCPRIAVNYENYFNGDQRIGAEMGASFGGLFTYAGYYQPIGSTKIPGFTPFRVGIRFVLNWVLIEAAPPE